MQGLSPSKNTEGYFVLQVGSTLSKDAIIHYLREDISEFSVQAGSHLSLQKLPLTGSPRCLSYLVGRSFSSIDTFVEYAVKTLGAKMKQLWETRNIPRSFFSQAQLVQAWTPKRHRVPAGGAHRQDPHDIDDPHYPAWISGKQAFTLNKEDESFQQWEVQSSQLRKSLLRCAKGEPSRSRRSCWWRRGGLAGPAPRGTRLSLVQV